MIIVSLVMVTAASVALTQFMVGLVCAVRYRRARIPAVALMLAAVAACVETPNLPYRLSALADDPGRLPGYGAVIVGWVVASLTFGVWLAARLSGGRVQRPSPLAPTT